MAFTGHKRLSLAYRALLAAAMLGGFVRPSSAQMYPGADVNVNQSAAGGARVLRYPGGQYLRVLPPLLEPGEPYPGDPRTPIHLRRPVHRATAAHQAPPVAENEPAPEQKVSEAAASAPKLPQAKPPQAKRAARQAAAEPAPAENSAASIPFSFGGGGSAATQAPPKPPAERPRQAAAAKPEKTASAAPVAAAAAAVRGLAKQAAILFDQNSSDLTGNNSVRLKDLSPSLNAALLGGADRVELIGYGGAPGEKSSDARRLSLKRALAIREALIVDGLPANRIDVRALGGADDDGPANRVDIFVKG